MVDGEFRFRLNLQQLHDEARAASEAFDRMADRIAEEYGVCTHPKESREYIEIDETTVEVCAACDSTLVERPTGEGDGDG